MTKEVIGFDLSWVWKRRLMINRASRQWNTSPIARQTPAHRFKFRLRCDALLILLSMIVAERGSVVNFEIHTGNIVRPQRRTDCQAICHPSGLVVDYQPFGV
jgi:hypothetical protein